MQGTRGTRAWQGLLCPGLPWPVPRCHQGAGDSTALSLLASCPPGDMSGCVSSASPGKGCLSPPGTVCPLQGIFVSLQGLFDPSRGCLCPPGAVCPLQGFGEGFNPFLSAWGSLQRGLTPSLLPGVGFAVLVGSFMNPPPSQGSGLHLGNENHGRAGSLWSDFPISPVQEKGNEGVTQPQTHRPFSSSSSSCLPQEPAPHLQSRPKTNSRPPACESSVAGNEKPLKENCKYRSYWQNSGLALGWNVGGLIPVLQAAPNSWKKRSL